MSTKRRNGHLAELAYADKAREAAARKTAVYTPVHEDLSTDATSRFAAEAELSKMAICIIGPFPEDVSVIRGGVQASVYGMAQSLKTHADIDSVKVISLPVTGSRAMHTRPASVEGTEVIYLRTHRFLAEAVFHLPLILRHTSPAHIVHIHGTGLVQAVMLGILLGKGTKCVWTLHGITEKETRLKYLANKTTANRLRHWFYKTLEHYCVQTAPHIVVDTPYVAEAIGNPCNLSVIPQGGLFREEFAQMPRLPGGAPLILSVGVIHPRKGHHLTLQAFSQLRQTHPQATLIIAGASSDAHYLEALKRQAEKVGNVEILANLPRRGILELYAKARIFALHSQEESQGLALCEAMAAGLPVAATKSGGIPYVVSDGETGKLVEYGDVEGFASAMTSLLDDAGTYEKMSQAARISATRFDWKHITDEIIRVYSNL